MTKRLSEGDRRAVDLLLDRAAVAPGRGNGSGDGDGTASAGNGGGAAADGATFVSHAVTAEDQRVRAVSRVLHLLDNLPAPEPADDLVARTLRRLGEPVPAVPSQPGYAPRPSPQQPHA